MPLFAGKTPTERYQTIAALALGLVAVLFLGRMFFGSSSSTTKTPPKNPPIVRGTPADGAHSPAAPDGTFPDINPVPPIRTISFDGGDGGRNIFAFYEKPVPTPTVVNTPPPTPTPTPPLTLSAVSPTNVFAQTDAFTLNLNGDKFTPQARVYVDSQELPTTYTSAQQLSAQVPAALIAAPGTRQVIVRTPDGQLYSNPLTVSVADPPKPQFTYIGLLGGSHYNDKAMIKSPTTGGIIAVQRGDQNLQASEVATVQRGDVVGGRFRVTSISERSIDLVDTQLRIKHTLPYVESRNTGAPGMRPYTPQPPTADDDEEPN